jgi:hypothetical protein
VVAIVVVVAKFHHLFDYEYDNDNRSAIASLTTSRAHTHPGIQVIASGFYLRKSV